MQKIKIVKLPDNKTILDKNLFLEKLPKSLHNRAYRYVNEESALHYILGRLMLKRALFEHKLPAVLIEEISYSKEGKPSFTNYNFSISHSSGYVSLIFGTNSSVGIDIEKMKTLELKSFEYLFTELEWKSISDTKNSLERFYWFWVRKEALLKAVGCTLKDLKKLKVFEHYGTYKDKYYYFESFEFDSDYNGIVALETKSPIYVELLDIKDLLEE